MSHQHVMSFILTRECGSNVISSRDHLVVVSWIKLLIRRKRHSIFAGVATTTGHYGNAAATPDKTAYRNRIDRVRPPAKTTEAPGTLASRAVTAIG